MGAPPQQESKGFGKAVRLATAHSFRSHTTRLQAGEPRFVLRREKLRIASLLAHAVVVLTAAVLSGWIVRNIAASLQNVPANLEQLGSLFGAVLLAFMGAFAFMRLLQAGWRAMIDTDDPMEWPREGADWGRQTVVLDRDGIAIAMKYVRRTYPWDQMALLMEDDVFVIDRKRGSEIVIPKDPADEDELRERLMRGITLSRPV